MALISIVIPVFNRAHLIANALRSVQQQTFSDWEVIVVDDGSADDLQRAVDECRIPGVRVVRHERNKGVSAARNTGIAHATGRYVAFLDSDDYWLPQKLERQFAAAEASAAPDKAFCVTRTRVMMGEGWDRVLPTRPPRADEPWSEFLYVAGEFAQTSSYLLSRRLAEDVQFRTELRQYEDHLFFIECGQRGAEYRLVDDALSVWKCDRRPDRLGNTDSIVEGRKFLNVGKGAITERARLAFLTRYLGPQLFREDAKAATGIFVQAASARAVGPRELVTVFLRCLMPAALYQKLRSLVLRRAEA